MAGDEGTARMQWVLTLENINSFNDGSSFMIYTFKIPRYEFYQFMFQAPAFKLWNCSIGPIIMLSV